MSGAGCERVLPRRRGPVRRRDLAQNWSQVPDLCVGGQPCAPRLIAWCGRLQQTLDLPDIGDKRRPGLSMCRQCAVEDSDGRRQPKKPPRHRSILGRSAIRRSSAQTAAASLLANPHSLPARPSNAETLQPLADFQVPIPRLILAVRQTGVKEGWPTVSLARSGRRSWNRRESPPRR